MAPWAESCWAHWLQYLSCQLAIAVSETSVVAAGAAQFLNCAINSANKGQTNERTAHTASESTPEAHQPCATTLHRSITPRPNYAPPNRMLCLERGSHGHRMYGRTDGRSTLVTPGLLKSHDYHSTRLYNRTKHAPACYCHTF